MGAKKNASEKTVLQRAVADIRGTFGSVGLFSFFINLLALTGPLYMMQVYDRVLASGSHYTLVLLTVVAVGMILISALLEAIRSRVLVRISAQLDGKLNEAIFSGLLTWRLREQDSDKAQPLRDLESLRGFLTGNGLISFFDAPWMPIFLAIIFVMHPLLGMVALGGALALFIIAVLSEFLTRAPLGKASGSNIAAHGFADAAQRNAEVIEAMGMLPGLRRRWLTHHAAAMAAQSRASDYAGLLTAAAKFTRPVLQIAILGVGAYLALQQIITPGVMIAASIIMGRALAPVEGAIGNWRSSVIARGAYRRLKLFLEHIDDSAPRMALPRPEGAIVVQNLVAAPTGLDKPVIKGIGFDLPAGASLGIIGPSAAGKSTLARLLVGVWAPASGHVRLDGADLATWNHVELGPHLGYLPQDVELFDGTVAENIARFTEPDSDMVVAAARSAGVHEMILQLPDGYDTVIGEGGQALSGGQRQRIGLARALYGDPALIVLDEPNANLDGDGEEALRQALLGLKESGTTLIIVAHRPNVLSVVDRLLVLRDGKIEHYGPRDEVMPKVTRAVAGKTIAGLPKAAETARSRQAG